MPFALPPFPLSTLRHAPFSDTRRGYVKPTVIGSVRISRRCDDDDDERISYPNRYSTSLFEGKRKRFYITLRRKKSPPHLPDPPPLRILTACRLALRPVPYDENNVFKKIIAGDIPSYKIFETEHALAFLDAFPMAKGHALLVPKATGYEPSKLF